MQCVCALELDWGISVQIADSESAKNVEIGLAHYLLPGCLCLLGTLYSLQQYAISGHGLQQRCNDSLVYKRALRCCGYWLLMDSRLDTRCKSVSVIMNSGILISAINTKKTKSRRT